MTREEWNAYAESVPLTPDQRGAILGHCDRLGLTDRGERLTVLAAVLDLDELESTAGLTLGQAGRLVNLLQHTSGRADLPDVTAAAVGDGQDDEHAGDGQDGTERITWPEAITRISVMVYVAYREKENAGKHESFAHNLSAWAREGGLSACETDVWNTRNHRINVDRRMFARCAREGAYSDP